ncbi:MAG: toxin-antitoxin system YwqK family antitoxin [Chlamydiota bacterium]|jgi:antitoxin component YwqK of YwqJK toxin-antitoxin module
MKILNIFLLSLLVLSCHRQPVEPNALVRIQTVDQNGLTETISSEEKLAQYKEVDFLSPQPFQKIVRIFSKANDGHAQTILTSYHPNGKIKQLLEGVNLRASGPYKEWYMNGSLKIEANVAGGPADLDVSSQEKWLFDGPAKAYDEQGNLIANIPYENGLISGEATHYFSNGNIKKKIPYKNGLIDGIYFEYFENMALKRKTYFQNNEINGTSLVYWENESPLAIEEYQSGKLITGQYYDKNFQSICNIQNGNGAKLVVLDENSYQLIEYKNGSENGLIQLFNKEGRLLNSYVMINGKKQGTESEYFILEDNSSENILKYTIDWGDDQIHGNVQTWYQNGNMESQKHFCKNKKNGPSICWYSDGSLMMVEEYENDLLVSGKYFRKGNPEPVSEVTNGKGVATLFDGNGIFLQKVTYNNSKPIL